MGSPRRHGVGTQGGKGLLRRGTSLLPILLALAAASLLVPASGCGSGEPRPRHNIILVTLDTTRADHLGAYGGPPGNSPVLDALAQEGVLFERAQAHSAVTPVAHASLFTGLNPYAHGLRTLHGNRHFRLDDGVTPLAERLQDEGYDTAAFISAFPCSERFGLDRGFDVFDGDFGGSRARIGSAGNVSTGTAQRGAAATTAAALEWLAGRDRQRPFFLWVHYFDAHDPLVRPPAAFVDPFMEGFDAHEEMERALGEDMPAFVERYAGVPELMRPWLRRLYAAEIAYADHQMGRLLREVRDTGLLAGTLVAVTADHGEGLGDHDWWGHGILYQEQVHVPLVLAGPGLPVGVRVTPRVRHVDLAPTLLELAGGMRFAGPLDGIDLAPLIDAAAAGTTAPPGRLPGPAYADSVSLMRYGAVFSRDVVEEKDDQLYSWIEGDLKWIRHRLRPAESELYDLAADPDELQNLISRRGRDAARLDAALEKRSPMTEEIDFSLPDDPEVLRRLRSLGYVGGAPE